MKDYFAPRLDEDQLRAISSIGLAHLGDAVYELLVRSWLCGQGRATGKGLHPEGIDRLRQRLFCVLYDFGDCFFFIITRNQNCYFIHSGQYTPFKFDDLIIS